MSDTILILLRHGETDWNRERRIQGRIDTPLNDEGLRQARAAARRLAAEADGSGATPGSVRSPGGPTARPTAMVSSDLQRCRQTAEPIAGALGIDCVLEPRLRERAFGAFEGRTPAELRRDQPLLYERWQRRDPDFDADGGESLRVFADRIRSVLDELAAAHRGGTLVVVTHGGVLDVVHRIARGMPLEAARNFDLPNASLNRLRFDGDRYEILEWGVVSHWRDALDEIGPA
jgi:probable phosphoglycerate mutase